MKRALYIGNFSFPTGNASGKRVYANGKALRELGYEVLYIGLAKGEQGNSLKDSESEHDGFKYYNLPYPRGLEWLNYKSTYRSVVDFLKQQDLIKDTHLVVLYGSPSLSPFNMLLLKFCRRNNIKVVADCVDWLSAETGNPFFNVVKRFDNAYQKAYVNKRTDGVIAISKYLADYYRKAGCKTVIIPPLSPAHDASKRLGNTNENEKVITYAGQPFRLGKPVVDVKTLKDRIDKTIIMLTAAKEEGCEFIFNVYGLTKEEYLQAIPSQLPYIEDLGSSIFFHGLTPNEIVVKRIAESDFTILVRDVNRGTGAGFPTKVSESISCGTPVITTNTSDLDDYIQEGINGYFIEHDMGAATRKIVHILNQNRNDVARMKSQCIDSRIFHYAKYVDRLSGFLEQVL